MKSGGGERAKLARGMRQESRRVRLIVLVIGFFLITLTFVVVSKPEAILFNSPEVSNRIPGERVPSEMIIKGMIESQEKGEGSAQDPKIDPKSMDDDEKAEEDGQNYPEDPKILEDGEKAETSPQNRKEDPRVVDDGEEAKPQRTDEEHREVKLEKPSWQTSRDGEHGGEKTDHQHKVTLPTVSNYTINDSAQGEPAETDQEEGRTGSDARIENNALAGIRDADKMAGRPLCDMTNFRTDICDMEGNIRVHPNTSSIIFMESGSSQRNELWKIKPYPRKGDEFCLSHVKELTVKSSREAPQCTKYHDVPALVFSITGYTGNLFHDFTDVIVPLFTTANEFNGEIQFLITDMQLWWTIKYNQVLQKLSKYPPIDFNKDDQVHCFKRVIVGTHAYKEFTIDTEKAPHHYTMVDFARFMRRAYSLGRDTASILGERPNTKPRLLVISRKRSRMFLNLKEIVAMAEDLGYEVIVNEADVASDISQFARIVNSVDVMMGVHGAGLTNCVFLPLNATLIQVVPWGGLDWISRLDFGDSSEAMGLHYTQYSITVDESSLTEQYPRDHEIFKNPYAFHKRGFHFIRQTFMDNQNVRLDLGRFKNVLLDALDHLNP